MTLPCTLVDAVGNHTTWVYDAVNRPAVMTDPLGSATTTSYDAAGRVDGVMDATGRKKNYAYDAAAGSRPYHKSSTRHPDSIPIRL